MKAKSSIRIGTSVNEYYAPTSIGRAIDTIEKIYSEKQNDISIVIEPFQEGVNYIQHSTSTPHNIYVDQLIKKYFEQYDGLIIPGNSINIHPAFYNNNLPSPDLSQEDNRRTKLELALFEYALKNGIPVLGICGGHQIISVYLGLKLTSYNREYSEEDVIYLADTQLNTIIQEKTHKGHFKLNSTEIISKELSMHKQMIDSEFLGDNLLLVFAAKDQENTIKAIEVKGHHPFVIGTQFHPERGSTVYNHNLFEQFIITCETVKEQKYNKAKVLKTLKSTFKDKEKLTFFTPKINIPDALIIQYINSYLKINNELKKDELKQNIINLADKTQSMASLIYVYKNLTEQDRQEFLQLFIKNEKSINIINHIDNVVMILSMMNKKEMEMFLNHPKCVSIIANNHDNNSLLSVINLLPEECRYSYLQKHNLKFIINSSSDNDLLSVVDILHTSDNVMSIIDLLPQEDRLSFVIKKTLLNTIHTFDHAFSIMNALSLNNRLSFAMEDACLNTIHSFDHILLMMKTIFPSPNDANHLHFLKKIQCIELINHIDNIVQLFDYFPRNMIKKIMISDRDISNKLNTILSESLDYSDQASKLNKLYSRYFYKSCAQYKLINYKLIRQLIQTHPILKDSLKKYFDSQNESMCSLYCDVYLLPQEQKLKVAVQHIDLVNDKQDLITLLETLPPHNQLFFLEEVLLKKEICHSVDDIIFMVKSSDQDLKKSIIETNQCIKHINRIDDIVKLYLNLSLEEVQNLINKSDIFLTKTNDILDKSNIQEVMAICKSNDQIDNQLIEKLINTYPKLEKSILKERNHDTHYDTNLISNEQNLSRKLSTLSFDNLVLLFEDKSCKQMLINSNLEDFMVIFDQFYKSNSQNHSILFYFLEKTKFDKKINSFYDLEIFFNYLPRPIDKFKFIQESNFFNTILNILKNNDNWEEVLSNHFCREDIAELQTLVQNQIPSFSRF